MRKKLTSRFRSRSGFTLSETLVAIIILLLVTVIVAAGIPVASRAYSKVVTSGNAQVLLSTTMTCLRDELGNASDVSVDQTNISYTSQDGSKSMICLGGAGSPGIYVRQYIDVPGASEYYHPLVSDAASNKGLHVTYKIDGYTSGVLTFSDIEVKEGDRTIVSVDSFKIRVTADVS